MAHTRLTKDRVRLLKSWLREHFAAMVEAKTTQPEAAAKATEALGFKVTSYSIRKVSKLLRYRWPNNPRPRGPSKSNSTPDVLRGKRLSRDALDSLRYMANHMLEYAAEIEHICNTGKTSTTI